MRLYRFLIYHSFADVQRAVTLRDSGLHQYSRVGTLLEYLKNYLMV